MRGLQRRQRRRSQAMRRDSVRIMAVQNGEKSVSPANDGRRARPPSRPAQSLAVPKAKPLNTTTSEALIGAASWLEAVRSVLEKEVNEFGWDPAFVELMLSKTDYETMRDGLARVTGILRLLEADARKRRVS
jgi:hypothetical protein